ncbi:hypothetical protein PAJ34TS1_25260 [Paenibacillus azoreducens]
MFWMLTELWVVPIHNLNYEVSRHSLYRGCFYLSRQVKNMDFDEGRYSWND